MDASIISSLILSGSGIITSLILGYMFGYLPRQRKIKIISLQKELLRIYSDVLEFHKLENDLLLNANISKNMARKNFRISHNSENKRVQKRIIELENQIK